MGVAVGPGASGERFHAREVTKHTPDRLLNNVIDLIDPTQAAHERDLYHELVTLGNDANTLVPPRCRALSGSSVV